MTTKADLPGLSEAAWLRYVMDAAAMGGWHAMHISNSRRVVRRYESGENAMIGDKHTKGWPDLTLAHPALAAIVFAELKTERGRLTPSQRVWLDVLATNPGVHVALWRPADVSMVERALLHHDLGGAQWWPEAA